jgi:hypothetical protein
MTTEHLRALKDLLSKLREDLGLYDAWLEKTVQASDTARNLVGRKAKRLKAWAAAVEMAVNEWEALL